MNLLIKDRVGYVKKEVTEKENNFSKSITLSSEIYRNQSVKRVHKLPSGALAERSSSGLMPFEITSEA